MSMHADPVFSGKGSFEPSLGAQSRTPIDVHSEAVRAFEDAMTAADAAAQRRCVDTFRDALGRGDSSRQGDSPAVLFGTRSAPATQASAPVDNPFSERGTMSDALRLSENTPRPSVGGSAPETAAPRERRDAFEKAIGRHDLETGGLKHDSAAAPIPEQRPSVGVESLFAGFSGFAEQIAPQSVSAAPEQSALPEEALDQLVSRILVSSPDEGPSQVRITLNDNVLRATEIILTREVSGALTVAVDCRDASSFQTMVASRNALVEALEAQEKGSVTVQMSQSTNEEANDPRKRSRGLDALADSYDKA